MWLLYEVLLLFGLLLYLPKAVWRRRLPHRGWSMRLGIYPEAVRRRLKPGSTWVHAVSVGEVQAVQPVLRALAEARPQDPIVLSTITPSGFHVASRVVGERGIALYFPLDFRWCVGRALTQIRPRILILVESELWPGMIRFAKQRHIPVVVINGRISAKAFRRSRWVKPWLGSFVKQVDCFLMQTEADATRARQLGASPEAVKVLGSLKWDASRGAGMSPEDVKTMGTQLQIGDGEPLLVAGSTHRGEERCVVEAFQALRGRLPTLKLVIAPRHLERIGEVEGVIRHAGFVPQRISQVRRSSTAWDVAILDTLGELARYYRLASVVFVGGSLIPHGGQNPLEPASLGKPVIFGPSMENFEEIAERLLTHRAARQIAGDRELIPALQELFFNPQEAQAMGDRAKSLVERSRGVAEATLRELSPLLTGPSSPT